MKHIKKKLQRQQKITVCMTIITVLTVSYAVVYDWAHSTVNDIYHSGTQHTP